MNYRTNPRNGDQLSILGYGCMRFPRKGKAIDLERTRQQVLRAIEQGVNYFDTAYVYNQSEQILGQILAGGTRSRVRIATKLPHFLVKKQSDFDRIFQTQLKRLQTDYIDYYLIHMLSDFSSWERLVNLGVTDWIAACKASGQIRNIGFSYHGGPAEFIHILDGYDWDFTQIQYNYLDENSQAGKSGLLHAASKGLPVIIMEPLRGGKIINELPRAVQRIWESATPRRSVAEWALRWVWNHPEATVVLSGMNTEEQIEENIRIASTAQANEMSAAELDLFVQARTILSQQQKIGCTACGYCLPCPAGVAIPTCFSYYNEQFMKRSALTRFKYLMNTGAASSRPGNASHCVSCRKCEQHCPQQIVISERMKDVARTMEPFWFKPAVTVIRKFMG